MRLVEDMANQCTDDIWDQCGHGNPPWDLVEREVADALAKERERCAELADFYNSPVLAKAIRDGAFVDDGAGAWWE